MPPPKKKLTVRGTLIRRGPDPPKLQDVVDEIDEIKGTLASIQYLLGEINRKIDDLPGELERG